MLPVLPLISKWTIYALLVGLVMHRDANTTSKISDLYFGFPLVFVLSGVGGWAGHAGSHRLQEAGAVSNNRGAVVL